MIKIAVDAMGGDFAPQATVVGSMQAIKEFSDIEIVLFGDEGKIKPFLTNNERISVVHTPRYIDMGEHDPVHEIRTNKDSSLVMAFTAAKEGTVDAVVSAGPTQAVIVGAHLIIKKLPFMHRVALAPIIPSIDGRGIIMLDVGANVELRAEHILELATYASGLARVVFGVNCPRIGLINIGSEEGKGRVLDQEAYQLLKNSENLQFIGNVEPKEMFLKEVEVLVTDGFSGNLVLKTIEGSLKASGKILKQEIKRNLRGKIGYLFLKPALNRYVKRLDANEVGGAMICGVCSPIVKAHGSSDDYAFKNAIKQVRSIVKGDVITEVSKMLKKDE